MPRTPVGRNKLDELPIAPDQEVRGDMQRPQLIEEWMMVAIQAIGEQVDDERPAELAGRQTDVMDDQQIDRRVLRPAVAIRGGDAFRFAAPAVGIDKKRGLRKSHVLNAVAEWAKPGQSGSLILSFCIW